MHVSATASYFEQYLDYDDSSTNWKSFQKVLEPYKNPFGHKEFDQWFFVFHLRASLIPAPSALSPMLRLLSSAAAAAAAGSAAARGRASPPGARKSAAAAKERASRVREEEASEEENMTVGGSKGRRQMKLYTKHVRSQMGSKEIKDGIQPASVGCGVLFVWPLVY